MGTAPTNQVNINIGVDDLSEVNVNPSSLSFTSDDWFVPQSVMINGVDDEFIDGSQKTDLIFSVAPNTSDQNYINVTPVLLKLPQQIMMLLLTGRILRKIIGGENEETPLPPFFINVMQFVTMVERLKWNIPLQVLR